MFECQSCGRKFEEPAFHTEGDRETGYFEVAGCPFCGGGYIDAGRDCMDCIWNAGDDCTSWECDYVSRDLIRKLIKMGRINLEELAKEVKHGC